VSLATTTKSYKTVQEPIKIPGLMDEEIKLEASDDEESNSTTLDSNKRKLLPAWIREGLEKMEREKQRNERNEKEMKERQKLMEERRRLEEEAIRELQKSNQSFVPKSKFVSIIINFFGLS
jgi:CHASE3 domain sensor protein